MSAETQQDAGGHTEAAHDVAPAKAANAPAADAAAHEDAAKGDAGTSLGSFTITHYTFALESDPKHKDSPKVSAPGLPADKKYRQSFLGSPYGIKMQGTGLAEDGQYIQYAGNDHYKYGVGGAAGPPVAWKTVAVDPRVIKLGSKLQIDVYKDKGDFTAKDTGGAIKGKHIDVFAGPVPISVAYALGTKTSVVRLLDANHHDAHPGGGSTTPGGGGTTQPPKPGAHHITASVGRGGRNTDKDVRAVQKRLKERGIDVGTVDGDCGNKTIRGIEQFQSTFMSHPDGLITPGHGTEKHLFDENGQVHPRGQQNGGQQNGGQQNGGQQNGGQQNGGQHGGQQEPAGHEGPSSYADIAKNFGASIPGSSHFTWHEALYLPSWGRHANAGEVSETILANIPRQAKALDKVRDHFGASISVHCWLRPPAYNKAIGGASNSAHLRGMATDFHIPGKSAEEVRKELKAHKDIYPGAGENNVSWVHLDLEHHAWFNP